MNRTQPARRGAAASFLPLSCVALLAACSPEHARSGVQGPSDTDETPMPLGASSAERFGGSPGPATPVPTPPAAASAASGFSYTLPEGWSQAPPKPLRDVNLAVPGGVECWVTLMGPGAGGLEPNVDRWRGQLGLGPASPADIAALGRRPFLGGEALRIDLSAPDGSKRMVGLMQFLPDRSIFLRMSGPADAVAQGLVGFEALADSMREGAAGAPAPGASTPGSAPESSDAGEAGAAGAPGGVDEPGVAGTPGSAGGLRWIAPAAWQSRATDAFRLAYFQVAPGTQCWISTLAGAGGGVEANLTRWYGQFGRSGPSATEIAALPTIPLLGRDALWVDLLGAGSADGMIGVLCEQPERSVFLKIQGPSDEVRTHEADFRAFCASLGQQ